MGGDDILTPNCIEENVGYVLEHPDAVAVFSRVWPFRTRFRKKVTAKRYFCYDFFNYSEQEKYHHLFYVANALPGQTAFFNVAQLRKLGIRHDERIPLFEDYPLWITFLRKGVRFDFMDKTTVWYRQHKKALSSNIYTPNYFKSNILFLLYYFLDEIKEERDRNHIYDLISNRATKIYGWAYYPATMYKYSLDYKIGYLLLSPFRFLKLIFSKLLYYTKVLLWRAFNR